MKKIPVGMLSQLIVAIAIFCASDAFGQALIQPTVFTRSPKQSLVAAGEPIPGEEPQQGFFSTADLTLPVYDKSQFGASSRVYTLSVLGAPKCTPGPNGQETCVSQYWFKLSVDANVVSAVSGEVSAVREYIFSQKGSPLSVSLPVHTWTTKKGTVRQSWLAFSPSGSARLIPVSTPASNLSGGGTLSIGGTGEAHIEFDETEPGTDPSGTDMTYPGTLYLSVTPTFAATLGGTLNSTVFQTVAPGHWIWGGEYRVGFQFQGKKPISLAITGTYSAKGLTASKNGVAISLSKLFGGQ